MKKTLFFFLLLVMVLTLVACGGEVVSTTQGKESVATSETLAPNKETTAPALETTVPTLETTAPTLETTVPVVTSSDNGQGVAPDTPPNNSASGTDILNGEPENMAIKPNWKGVDAIAFENHHAMLDFHVALVMLMQESENAIYEDLIMTLQDSEGNDSDAWVLNQDYKWVVTVDGKPIEIKRFSIYHQVTGGYVRLDLGEDFAYSADVDENGMHAYDVRLDIYNVDTDELVYFAWFTDPEWNGPYQFVAPAKTMMVPDEDRHPSHVAIEGAIPFGGPTGYTGELYENLFDDAVESKLCTNDLTTPIIWRYNEAKTVVSYSLVGARDDKSYPSRVLTKWKLYGSADGNKWVLLDEQNLSGNEEVVNYGERNFILSAPAEYTYFKLEPVDASKYQMSGLILYTKAE